MPSYGSERVRYRTDTIRYGHAQGAHASQYFYSVLYFKCLEAYQDMVISGSWDQSVVLWELEHGRKLVKLTGHTEVVNCVKMAGNKIISGSSDATLRIWELIFDRNEKTGKRIACLDTFTMLKDGHKSDILCVETRDDYVVSAGADSMVIVWNMAGDLLHRLGGHLGNVRCIYIDEFKCVTGGDAKRIMVWDYKVSLLSKNCYRERSWQSLCFAEWK